MEELNIMEEIDFLLGSIECCNTEPVLSILLKHGIDPDGGWIDIDSVPDEVINDLKDLF